jgi:two-component system sensor histidine kinase MtrB
MSSTASVQPRPLSLRSTLAALTILTAALILSFSALLVILTTLLHETTSKAGAAAESVRLAQEAQIELLLHSRADDAILSTDLEASLRRRLLEAKRFVTTSDEAQAIAAAEAEVSRYVAATRDPRIVAERREAQLETSYGALEALVDLNLAHAREATAAAAEWDRRAKLVGLLAVVPLLLATAGALFWLKHRALAPVFSLLDAMERFGKGEREARAPQAGPRELREMSQRFNDMATALSAQREARVAFLAGVAHDIRNPLSVLRMSMALVSPKRPLPSEPRLRALIDTITRQLTRLERMVGDLLGTIQVEAGKLELKLETVDSRQIVSEVLSLFDGGSSERRLVACLPDTAAPLRCDSVRVEQVLINLVSNALKYSPAGSPIEVALEPEPDGAVFRVSDRGPGIAEADRARVFEPFQRVGLSREAVPGVGLGLFVARRIVEAHGGEITIECTPGGGATFRVRLPASSAPAQPELMGLPSAHTAAPAPRSRQPG